MADVSPWVTIAVAVISGGGAGFGAYIVQERRLRKIYKLEDRAEEVARQLLSVKKWPLRSYKVIRHHLGGFEDAELRKILVRAGAIRFKSKSGEELWGLVERNKNLLGIVRINADPANLHDDDLFDVPRETRK